MIYYAIQKMVQAGIKDILIITGIEHCGSIISQCGDGSDFGCQLTYKVQVLAGGIAQALLLAEGFVGDDKCCVILGDNIFSKSLKSSVNVFDSDHILRGAKIFLQQVSDPKRFGVAELTETGDGNLIVTSIEEKPKKPKSNYAVTGIYMYDNTVFEKIKKLKPSARGQYEITDVNIMYMNQGTLLADVMGKDQVWTDAGTFESLNKANELFKG